VPFAQLNHRRLESLTGLRFLAAMAVIFRHFGQTFLAGWSPFFQREGQHGFVAVSFFFVLSGFVLTYSYSGENGELRGTPKAFYWARFARLYPAYLVAILLNANWIYLALREAYSPRVALLHLAAGGTLVLGLVQSWLPWTANYLNTPAWSLSVEAFFYLIFPFVLHLTKRLSKRQLAILLIAFWLAAMSPTLAAWASNRNLEGRLLSTLLQSLPILRVPEFVMGSLTARLFLLLAPSSSRYGTAAAWACCGAVFALLGCSLKMPEAVLGNGLFAPLFCLSIWFASTAGGLFKTIFASPLLLFLGEISYSIYILQEPVARWFQYITGRTVQSEFLAFVVFLLSASAGCFYVIERPIGRAIRNWTRSHYSNPNTSHQSKETKEMKLTHG
jgi:peptidoglycan/LPS O-acetylase OafA/YrhL